MAKLLGLFLFGVACLQPKVCFRFPPKAFWLFLLYFSFYGLLAIFHDATYDRTIVMRGISFAQMLVLFWLSYNLMNDERVIKGFLWAFIGACVSLPLVGRMVGGVMEGHKGGDVRMTILGQNPGTVGATLALGVIALLGLAYGRQKGDYKIQFFAWVPFLLMAGFLVSTGSRGAMLSLVIGMAFFFLKGGNIQAKLGLGLVVIFGIGALAWVTIQFNPETVNRIENSINEGDTAGREIIYFHSIEMFNEKPLFGWGPVRYRYELSNRVGYERPERDPHNLILKILLEVGIIGSIPFFLGLGSCLFAAWKARDGLQGALPLSMLVTVFMINMSHTWDNKKIFWIILAYGLVSAKYLYPRKTLNIHPYSINKKSSKKPNASAMANLSN